MRIFFRCNLYWVDASGSLIQIEVFLYGKWNGLLIDHSDDLLRVWLLWALKQGLLLKALRNGICCSLEIGLLWSNCEDSSIKTLLIKWNGWLFDCKRLFLRPYSIDNRCYWLSFLFDIIEVLLIENLLEDKLLLSSFRWDLVWFHIGLGLDCKVLSNIIELFHLIYDLTESRTHSWLYLQHFSEDCD